jgi:N6-adenosine-specific RNA methylase IME4
MYDLILADPPWRYGFSRSASRRVENQYETMTVEQIAAVEVPAAPDAMLYLWATAPKLREALSIVDAWGFEYRTCAVWDKGRIGMGYYFRSRHELLLVGKRGKPALPAPSTRVSSIIEERRATRHSQKPSRLYEILERMHPQAQKLELFARGRPRDGWTAWGDEVEHG